MPKASKATATDHVKLEEYEGHFSNLEGGYTVGFETYVEDADLSHLLKGLPDDRCQSQHWGYVVRGKMTVTTADGEETYEAGDAYYMPPGHLQVVHAGTELIEFSPTDQLQRTIDVINENKQAAES